MDISSLIIAICVITPALIAIIVCGIVFYSKRNNNRKFYRQRRRISFNEQISQDNRISHFPNAYHYQQQRHLNTSSSIYESPPPVYDNYPIHQTRTQQLPLFSPIRTTPRTPQVHRDPFVITPSAYSAMPPSYDEIFLTNR